jgi:WD40 repeat protein
MIRWDIKIKQMSEEERIYFLESLVDRVLSSQRWDRLEELLLNIFFLEAKAEAGKIFDLADDFTKAKAQVPENNYKHHFYGLFEEALRRDIHFIQRHPQTLFQCLWNSCWWHDCPELKDHIEGDHPLITKPDNPLYLLLENWKAEREKVKYNAIWLKALRPHPYPLEGTLKVRFSNQTESIKDISLSPDCTTAIICSYGRSVQLLNLDSGREIAGIDLPDAQGLFLGYDIQSRPYLLQQKSNRSCILTDFLSNKNVTISSIGMETEILACSEHFTLFLCIKKDEDLYLFDRINSKVIAECNFNYGKIQKAFLSEEFPRACLVTENKAIVWDYLSGNIGSIPDDAFTNITFSKDCRFAAWGGLGRIKVYDLIQKKPVNELGEDPSPGIQALAFSTGGNLVASGYDNGLIDIWDVNNGEKVNSFNGHSSRIECMFFSDDNSLMISGSEDTTACVWKTDLKTANFNISGHSEQITQVGISPYGRCIATASFDSTVKIWDTQTGRLIKTIPLDDISQGFCVDDKNRLFVGLSREIQIWDMNTLQQIRTIKSPGKLISKFVISQDGTKIAIAAKDLMIRIFDVDGGEEQAALKGHKDFIQGLSISPDNKLLASGSADATLRIWDIKKAGEISRITSKNRWDLAVPLVQFISDSRIVILWESKRLFVWDIESSAEVTCLDPDDSEIATFGVSDSGKYIACMTTDYKTTVWNTKDYKVAVRHKGFIGNSFDMYAFSDGWEKFKYTTNVNEQDCSLLSSSSHEIAWFPQRFVSILPSGSQWAAWQGSNFNIFTLIGNKDIFSLNHWPTPYRHSSDADEVSSSNLKMKKIRWWQRLFR